MSKGQEFNRDDYEEIFWAHHSSVFQRKQGLSGISCPVCFDKGKLTRVHFDRFEVALERYCCPACGYVAHKTREPDHYLAAYKFEVR